MNTLQAALEWYDRGVTPIPCKPGSKQPRVAWGKWQGQRPERDQVTRWFSTMANIALMCGNGLVVLDFDSMPKYWTWSLRTNLKDSYTVRTGSGRHVYFHCDKPTSAMFLEGIEVRSTPKQLIMAPPSVHPNGCKYEHLGGEIAEIGGITDVLDASSTNSVKEEGAVRSTHPLLFTESPGNKSLFSPTIAELKSYLPSYLSRLTTLIPSSRDGRWYVMRCPHPAHLDSNPSFWLDSHRHICGCFKPSCRATQPNRKSMDIFNLHAWLNDLTNCEAIYQLMEATR